VSYGGLVGNDLSRCLRQDKLDGSALCALAESDKSKIKREIRTAGLGSSMKAKVTSRTDEGEIEDLSLQPPNGGPNIHVAPVHGADGVVLSAAAFTGKPKAWSSNLRVIEYPIGTPIESCPYEELVGASRFNLFKYRFQKAQRSPDQAGGRGSPPHRARSTAGSSDALHDSPEPSRRQPRRASASSSQMSQAASGAIDYQQPISCSCMRYIIDPGYPEWSFLVKLLEQVQVGSGNNYSSKTTTPQVLTKELKDACIKQCHDNPIEGERLKWEHFVSLEQRGCKQSWKRLFTHCDIDTDEGTFVDHREELIKRILKENAHDSSPPPVGSSRRREHGDDEEPAARRARPAEEMDVDDDGPGPP